MRVQFPSHLFLAGSATNRTFRRDVAVIAGKCLAKDRQARVQARDLFREELEVADRLVASGSPLETRSVLLDCLRPLIECHRALGKETEAKACEQRIAALEATP